MPLLLASTYQWIAWHIPPLLHFSTTNNILILVKRSNLLLVFYKAACHANPGVVRKQAGSSSYVPRHLFRKYSNTVANNKVSPLWT